MIDADSGSGGSRSDEAWIQEGMGVCEVEGWEGVVVKPDSNVLGIELGFNVNGLGRGQRCRNLRERYEIAVVTAKNEFLSSWIQSQFVTVEDMVGGGRSKEERG